MKKSFRRRLDALAPSTDCFLRKTTLEQVFYGVGRVTHLVYPAQRLDQVTDDLQVTGEYRYISALRLAYSNLRSEDWRDEGVRVLTALLIEPFAAIHEICKEEKENDDL